ncbi:MAG: hypothetical protein M3514_17030 [Actinomycetota bacterium]|nr:hypothetical protein [Rubrobacteraceae bacterium]MDQ3499166.1 hypothetical protein [Actinomycetota bacterium]
MTATCEAFCTHEVREDLLRPCQDPSGREENLILGREHRHGSLKASKLFLGRHPGQASV